MKKNTATRKPYSKRTAPKQLEQLSSVPLAIRVSKELLQQLDDEVERLKQINPGYNVNRADVVRNALIRHLREAK
jgi:ribosomal protein S25